MMSHPLSLTSNLNLLLRLGAMMLRAGATAFRVRQSIQRCAGCLGIDAVSMHINLNAIYLSGSQDRENIALIKEVGSTGVNAERLCKMADLVRTFSSNMNPQDLANRLDAIENERPGYSILQTGIAVGAACGAFAVLNGGTGLEALAACLGGWAGQTLRSLLARQRWNQYAVSALCAVLASSIYCLLAVLMVQAGFGVPRHTVGFISSVLFLVPGFPLITALLDLLQHEMTAALTRLTYASMLMLSVALGLSFVISFVGFSTVPSPPQELSLPILLLVRAIFSFVAGSGFAILFNCSVKNVLFVGLLSMVGNEFRLALRDADWGLPLATFAGAFAVGVMASLTRGRSRVPRITLTVPGVIMMVPGLYAFDALVLFNHGEITSAIRATVLFCFGVGAMAMGLAAARFVTQPEWLKE